MIESADVNGRPALVAYVDLDFKPVEREQAKMVKVIFTDDEGGSVILISAVEDDNG